MSIYPYQTREVRDLAWACFSPPLLDTAALEKGRVGVSNCAFPLTASRRQWLEALDRDATPLLEHLAGLRGRRLGLYFESLWHFFLKQDDSVELVANNLPVQDDKRTLGEFDCLYFCRRRNCHVHLELAVKFYLGWCAEPSLEPASTWQNWLGPETRDRLDIKINRLLEHQIRLGNTAAARPVLASLGIKQLLREIEIKGYLFRPTAVAMPPPQGFHQLQRLRSWVRLSDLATASQATGIDGYQILPRMRWLSEVQIDPTEAISTPGELLAILYREMHRSPGPRLVAALDRSGAEIERFFVTGPDWPGL
jgi:hypothetical protein